MCLHSRTFGELRHDLKKARSTGLCGPKGDFWAADESSPTFNAFELPGLPAHISAQPASGQRAQIIPTPTPNAFEI